jgi:hypothetical protein
MRRSRVFCLRASSQMSCVNTGKSHLCSQSHWSIGEAERSCDGTEQESPSKHHFCFLQQARANIEQEINVQNMNVELIAQMFKNYQSNVLFHLEGLLKSMEFIGAELIVTAATDSLKEPS